MKRFLLLLLLWPALAWPATHYFCDCSTGAHASCVAGADGASGTDPATPWQTISKANATKEGAGPNDQILFCRGGAWPAGGGFGWTNTTSTHTQAAPLLIEAYTPSWGGSVRPILRFTGTAFSLSSNNDHNGITFKNLDLRGPDTVTDTHGLSIYANIHYMVADNVNFQGFHFGVSTSQSGLSAAQHSNDLIVRNSQFLNNRNSGAFASIANTVFENNSFINNGGCAGGAGCQPPNQRHTWYVGGESDGSTQNIVFRGNTATETSFAAGFCEGTAITGHGIVNGLIVENNIVYETVAAGGGCFGIGYGDNYGHTNEGISRGVYRGNIVANVGNEYFTFNASPGLIVENNVAVISGATFGNAFTSHVRNLGTSLASSAVTFRNNSAYYASGSSGSAFVFDASGTGTSNIVANNLVHIAGGSANCWSIGAKAGSDFTVWNYNLCRNLGSGTGGGTNTPFSGGQANGLTTDPVFVEVPALANNWNMAIQTTSPAKNAGTNTYCALRDKLTLRRDATCDIGSHEFGASSTTKPPSAPINLR
jgi:hypothetical protein